MFGKGLIGYNTEFFSGSPPPPTPISSSKKPYIASCNFPEPFQALMYLLYYIE